jgi:hypothetical protein
MLNQVDNEFENSTKYHNFRRWRANLLASLEPLDVDHLLVHKKHLEILREASNFVFPLSTLFTADQ